MLQYYDGVLGCFSYDSKLWEVTKPKSEYDTGGSVSLKWIGGNQPCDLPKGVTSCRNMFKDCELGEGFYLRDFDTSAVTNMSFMFTCCKLPEGFSLGDKFDTSSVVTMMGMFDSCKLPEGFSLGEKFDTSKVMNMRGMFNCCKLLNGFSLGNKFNTSNVTNMSGMFLKCKLPEGFTLGNKFYTYSVEKIDCMFIGCCLGNKVLEGDVKDIIARLSDFSEGNSIICYNKKGILDGALDVIRDIPLSSFRNCESMEEVLELVQEYALQSSIQTI